MLYEASVLTQCKKDIIFKKARSLLSEEMDIVQLLRNQRFLIAAVEKKIPKEEIAKIRKDTERTLVRSFDEPI